MFFNGNDFCVMMALVAQTIPTTLPEQKRIVSTDRPRLAEYGAKFTHNPALYSLEPFFNDPFLKYSFLRLDTWFLFL